MKQLAISFLFAILSFQFSQAQSPATNTISLTIDSKILGEQCKATVYLPEDYEKSVDKYPVIYVLDGEYNAAFTYEAANVLTGSEKMPPSIIIGIVSNNRNRDFTTPGDKNWQPPQEMPEAGGADKFLDYLEKELLPYVEKNYRTQPFRVIAGHSLGGLLAMHCFSKKPDLFQAYIALESSLWWNNGSVGNETISFLKAHPAYKGKLFVGRIRMPRSFWFPINVTVVDYLEKSRPAGLEYTYMEIDKEEHSTMVFPATYFGLRDIFSDYYFVMEAKPEEKAIMSYYAKLSAKWGYPVKIPQQELASLWNIAHDEKRYTDAVRYGELTIANYPNSSRAYMSLGSTYLKLNNTEMAIKMLTRSIELNPHNESAKQMLNSLGKN